MRNKLLIIVGIVLGGLAVVGGIRAVSNRDDRTGAARMKASLPHPEARNRSGMMLSDRQLQAAQQAIARSPADPEGYNGLCAAFLKKARETGDFSFNAKAEAALNQSFERAAPENNYEALKLKATLLLTYHRFAEALEVARRAQAAQPQDHDVYGALTDALVELGDYQGATEAAQTMMDLRPNTSSYARVSYLRSLYGDTEGAIETMRAAVESASPRDPESVAWCRVHLGDELLNAGRQAAAEREFDSALATLPDYHLALAAKARARLAAGNADAAIEFYKQAQNRVPLPEYAAALGDLYAERGLDREAQRQYQLFEFIERAGSAESRTYSRSLALFWADHDLKLDEALAIARRERATRADIYTSDALAWCLFKKGQLAEAKTAMEEALRLGTRDARLFYHAGMIYHALGDRQTGAEYLKSALDLNPFFDVRQAEVARQTLSAIAP